MTAQGALGATPEGTREASREYVRPGTRPCWLRPVPEHPSRPGWPPPLLPNGYVVSADIIPGAHTVLVVTEPGRCDLDALTRRVRRLAQADADPAADGPAVAAGGRGRDPGAVRRPGPRRGGRADRPDRRRGHREAFGRRIPGRLAGLLPRLRLPDRAGSRAARAAHDLAPYDGPGRLGGHRRPGRGRLPVLVPGRVAAARPHVGPDVGPGPGGTGHPAARDAGPVPPG